MQRYYRTGKGHVGTANGPYAGPTGNSVMKAKRVVGATPNSEMLTRIAEQELRAGGTLLYNPRTGKRTVIRNFSDTRVPGTTVRHDHYH